MVVCRELVRKQTQVGPEAILRGSSSSGERRHREESDKHRHARPLTLNLQLCVHFSQLVSSGCTPVLASVSHSARLVAVHLTHTAGNSDYMREAAFAFL